MFTVGALALIAAICDDWLKGRTVQVGGTSSSVDADRNASPARNRKGSVP